MKLLTHSNVSENIEAATVKLKCLWKRFLLLLQWGETVSMELRQLTGPLLPSPRSVFPNQGSAEHRLGFRDKSWNKQIQILKYREKFQISLEISREFLSGNWQYWSNLRAVPTASLFCFGRFVFKVIFSCIVSVFVSYCYSAASPVATERRALRQINFLDNNLAVIELRSPLSTFSGL
jgi:hypothetical protein